MKYTILNIIVLIGLSLLLAGAVYSGYRLAGISAEREQVKEDYSLSNSVTFGLFSIDQWRDRITDVLSNQIQGYHITKSQQRDILLMVEKQMHELVSKTVAEINQPKKGLGAKLKKLAFNTLVDSAELQAQVRPFAKTIVAKISSPESEARLKNIAGSKVNQLTRQIYDSVSVANYAVTKYVYKKYKVADPVTFNKRIDERLSELKVQLIQYVCIMLGCVLVALLLWLSLRKQVHLQTPLFVFALMFALVMLITGSFLPVIEVDARIQSLELELLNGKVEFKNQVLFYQSKSILGIVETLIAQPKPDAIVVGVLILLFILILPLLRLIAKGIYVLSSKKMGQNGIVRYLTFELGKWDMSDVMIVGMLMTYIGLNGILKSQLSGLNMHTESLNVITANGTSLQPGYFIFAGYVLFAILLSYILKRVSPHDEL
ncbi:paraquat-inducible protein A [Mucilaginibacter aquaedulcis]|uniref:paraquat-inducible protein A n=1 Tax=Mucilaginibacter aquaedulcis TaxID=1187081 RepID=UPI0025B4BB7F|nr:paraquat-inducible protein A [Mucilaginibacter aquaedulcis]MDN3548712.1 paraquat-inducible protein A [Mucilaginibacter aquaedulcis]